MDPLTHTLTGLALSRAGFNRKSAYATPVLLLAANAPDVDIVALSRGSTSYLEYHRHITHSLLFAPLLAGIAVLLVRLFARKTFSWGWLYGAALAGVASHLAIDWTNAYGIRLLLPFSAEWLRLDIANLFDIWIWAVLLFAALGPLLARLVSSEIGARPGSGRGLALVALAFFATYDFGRWVLHNRALAVLEARLYQDTAPTRVAALPGPVNPFVWRGLVETPAFYSVNEVNLLGEFDPAAGRVLYKPEPTPAEQAAWAAASRTEPFRAFLGFAQYPLRRFEPSQTVENALRVEAMDLRFGAPPQAGFVASALVRQNGQIVEAQFQYGMRGRVRAR